MILQEIIQYFDLHWIELLFRFLSTLFGAILGFGGALFLFYKRLRHDSQKDNLEKEIARNNLLNHLSSLISAVVSNINRQNELTSKLIKDLKDHPDELAILNSLASKDIERIQTIKSTDILMAYTGKFEANHKESLKRLDNFYNDIDFLGDHLNELSESIKNYYSEAYKNLSAFRDMVDDIPDQLASFALEIKKTDVNYKSNSEYTFLEQWTSIYHKLVQEKVTPIAIKDQFLKPINKEIVDSYQMNFFAQPILMKARKAVLKINNHLLNVKSTIELASSSSELTKPALERLSEFQKTLEKNWRSTY